MRVKKMPALQKLVSKVSRGPKPRQTADQMMTIAKMWAVFLGGDVVTKHKH